MKRRRRWAFTDASSCAFLCLPFHQQQQCKPHKLTWPRAFLLQSSACAAQSCNMTHHALNDACGC
jgi:hypothetical protein